MTEPTPWWRHLYRPGQWRSGGTTCAYCGRVTEPYVRRSGLIADSAVSRDHVYPRARGGDVWVICCRRCNQDKADLLLGEWLAVLAANGDPRRDMVADAMVRLRGWMSDAHLGWPDLIHPAASEPQSDTSQCMG